MTIGKRLLLWGIYASGAGLLLFLSVAVPALSDLLSSGRQFCLPGRSIKCYEKDCGNYYSRCGKEDLEVVPDGKVCYRGALVSAGQTDACPASQTPLSPLVPCNCNHCSADKICSCVCYVGVASSVYSSNKNKYYRNSAVAKCCGVTDYHPLGGACEVSNTLQSQPQSSLAIWVLRATVLRSHVGTRAYENIQSVVSAFTFKTPLVVPAQSIFNVSDETPSGCCYPGPSDPLYKCCNSVC